MLKMPKNMLKPLFETLIKFVHSEGGDGCGFLVAGKHYAYEDIALAFGEELRDRGLSDSYFREDFDGYALFTDGSNESFIISQEVLSSFGKDIEIML